MHTCKHVWVTLCVANDTASETQAFEDPHLHQVLTKYNCKNLKQAEGCYRNSNLIYLSASQDIPSFRAEANVSSWIIIIISLLQYILGNYSSLCFSC